MELKYHEVKYLGFHGKIFCDEFFLPERNIVSPVAYKMKSKPLFNYRNRKQNKPKVRTFSESETGIETFLMIYNISFNITQSDTPQNVYK